MRPLSRPVGGAVWPCRANRAAAARSSIHQVVLSEFVNWFLVANRLMLTLHRFEGGRSRCRRQARRDAPPRCAAHRERSLADLRGAPVRAAAGMTSDRRAARIAPRTVR
ncbi:hypothetical protein D0U02_26565 [Burkholderia pseudomallei]|uniref:Uncharacterized protein n=1 Tax=Burkholderia pseudomallei TaxID=28450 RepID=A0AAX0U3R9_BURPE|nr:hypothetical protein BHT10_17910 [Burkholderia pseudomallei]PNW96460.1 hypothetical protein CF649_29440 [Burkholderia sp. 136(2017)]PNX11594.1 hypothetical protein CF650_29770 [Burkholderia sp. 129]PNX25552.1 hypothetical protein CF647_30310 [Burkholderia sp. 117]PNX33777.1 hypothetical protein CF648_29445 [Burkholderia sp. 137]